MALEKSLFSGKDVEEALDKASQYYNVNESLLQYRVVARDQSLFSPLSGEVTVKIERIGKKDNKRKVPAQIQKAENMLNDLFKKGHFSLKASYRHTNGSVELDVVGKDSDLLLEKNGTLLDAFQYLINRMIPRNVKMKIVLECEGFRRNRVRELQDMAAKAAEKVRDFGKPYLFSPMNPAERRQIHLALQDDKMISTESLGDGRYKRVKVFIKKRG
ncbi:MAG: hypothetical protein DRJ08_01605 [Acidobacteria bacterium]|nr:MAG: hypothetical protein DRJ14_07700 [Acidobacteriota bacterium]RLE24021.1 MAG: hypothetical protein DRJ08_01605 [Acidobacteriota bacterium]